MEKQSPKLEVYRSERFRTPLKMERDFGLWVDRIGSETSSRKAVPGKLRLLGLFGAVGVQEKAGWFISTLVNKSRVEEGDAILLFPEIPAAYGSAAGWRTNWVVWEGEEAVRLSRFKLPNPEEPLVRGGAEAVNAAYEELRPLMQEESALTVFRRKNIVMQMISELAGLQNRKHGSDSKAAAQAVRIINQNLHSDVSVTELAAACGYSETHFRRLFKRAMGSSPKEFIMARKMSKAKEYLAQNIPVKEVSELLGFPYESHFRSVFRRITGNTPKDYQV